MEKEWSPDPEIIQYFQELIAGGAGGSLRITFEGRTLSFRAALEEIRQRTPFGKRYYHEVLEEMWDTR